MLKLKPTSIALQQMSSQQLHKVNAFVSQCCQSLALAGLPLQPVAPEEMSQYVRDRKPGAVIVGSHVKRPPSSCNSCSKKLV